MTSSRMGFEDWAKLVAPKLWVVASKLSANDQDAEDLVADSVARAYVSWDRIQDLAWKDGWLLKTATNLACDRARRRRRRVKRIQPVGAPQFEESVEARRILVTALRNVPPRQREAIVLHYLAGLEVREVAEIMQLSPTTVKTHMSRGLATLRTKLDPSTMEDFNA